MSEGGLSRQGSNNVEAWEERVLPTPPPSGAALARQDVHHETNNHPQAFVWLVPAFAALNIVIFVIPMFVNDCRKNSVSCVIGAFGRFSFESLKENPLLGPSSTTLEKMGALDVSKVVRGHQGWRLVTCMWLHAGVLHLLANMLSLLVIGIRLEQEFGFVRIGLLYAISGLGGSLVSALFLRTNISVGASGALFGLLGGMLSELITNWSIYENKVLSLVTLVIIVAVNLAVGILPHVDNFAHIGGFMSGFLLGFVLLIRPQFGWVDRRYALPGHPSSSSSSSPKYKYKPYQCMLLVISLAFLIVGFTFAMVLLFQGLNLNDQCSWCHYLSCVPTKKWSCDAGPPSCSVTSAESGDHFSLICLKSGKSKTYYLQNFADSQIQGLCTQLCR